jgi:hypothetical protein
MKISILVASVFLLTSQAAMADRWYFGKAKKWWMNDCRKNDVGEVRYDALSGELQSCTRDGWADLNLDVVQGPMGPQGPQGLPGTPGAQGPEGKQGPQGLTGADGAKGDTGAQGPEGKQGMIGNTGPSCTIETSQEGDKTLTCPDSTTAALPKADGCSTSFYLAGYTAQPNQTIVVTRTDCGGGNLVFTKTGVLNITAESRIFIGGRSLPAGTTQLDASGYAIINSPGWSRILCSVANIAATNNLGRPVAEPFCTPDPQP